MRPNDTEINGFEMEELTAVKEEEENALWITVDSGASENVVSEKMAPQFEVKPSKKSRGGGRYVTADGSLMNNKEEKIVKVRTKEGHKCVLKMHFTDVQKPLMSVSRICDAGHVWSSEERRVHRARRQDRGQSLRA